MDQSVRAPRQAARPHVLIIVQNLPVPFDRRVWLECQALASHGYEVSVICPKGPGDPARQVIHGVHLYKYAPPPQAEGLPGYALEFVYCWLRTAILSLVVRARRPFTILQACNPPDTYWLLARLWRPAGVRFIFDHHDLNPELYLSRFGQPTGAKGKALYRGLLWLERMTFRAADRVISTNESYRRIAIERGGLAPHLVTVVRSGPDTHAMRPLRVEATGDKPHELVYLGIMGPQDGVDQLLLVMDELRRRGRRDVQATLMGFGDCLEDLRRQCTDMGLDPWVTFTGRVDRDEIATRLSAADIGLGPDLKTPLNDLSTMNKTMEYMAYGLPSVAFDLVETRVSGSDAVLYVPSGDIIAFADAVERLLDDPDLRVELGLRARHRVASELDWRPQARAYIGVYDELLGGSGTAGADDTPFTEPPAGVDKAGRPYVDLRDDAELRHFIASRGRGTQPGE